MAITYLTKENETLDLICWRVYGNYQGAEVAVMEANRGLADHGVILPGGLTITLPDLAPQTSADTIKLWD
jgi:phage tail protein X